MNKSCWVLCLVSASGKRRSTVIRAMSPQEASVRAVASRMRRIGREDTRLARPLVDDRELLSGLDRRSSAVRLPVGTFERDPVGVGLELQADRRAALQLVVHVDL